MPMSPRPAAPSKASTSACSSTSPSECATTPCVCGTRTPASMTLSPGPKAWMSNPEPTLNVMSVHFAGGEVRIRQQQICGAGDLDIGVPRFDQLRRHPLPFHRLGLVGGGAPERQGLLESQA